MARGRLLRSVVGAGLCVLLGGGVSEPVRLPADVLEGLEAVRRYAGTHALDVATLRYLANERGRRTLVVWIDRHPEEYGRGLLDGFQAEG
jgi:hypothetical protein